MPDAAAGRGHAAVVAAGTGPVAAVDILPAVVAAGVGPAAAVDIAAAIPVVVVVDNSYIPS